ncbi:MAG: hypothetical protein V2I34_02000 [Bacteroidales bacterium]|jgi:hypothetical protein|nr:hypothetical protein [Bacteroidales bacterium]
MKIIFKKGIIALVLVVFFSAACSQNTDDDLPPVIAESCLGEFALEPCELLVKSRLAQLASIDEQSIELEPPDIEPGEVITEYTQVYCIYKWSSDRTSTMSVMVGDTEVQTEISLSNTILVGNLKVITEEDLLEFNDETYSDYYDRNYAVNNEATQQDVRGIGDKAVAAVISQAGHSNWDKTSLSVLHKNVVFIVEADISDDNQADLDMAKKIAEEILARCD